MDQGTPVQPGPTVLGQMAITMTAGEGGVHCQVEAPTHDLALCLHLLSGAAEALAQVAEGNIQADQRQGQGAQGSPRQPRPRILLPEGPPPGWPPATG